MLFLLLAASLLSPTHTAPSCDDEYGQLCPESSPDKDSLGVCLAKNDASLSASCKEFIKINNACEAELAKQPACSGTAWTPDSVLCLTGWVSDKSDFSAGCVASLPVPEKPKEEAVDPEREKKMKRRKAARNKAAKEVRNILKEQAGGDDDGL